MPRRFVIFKGDFEEIWYSVTFSWDRVRLDGHVDLDGRSETSRSRGNGAAVPSPIAVSRAPIGGRSSFRHRAHAMSANGPKFRRPETERMPSHGNQSQPLRNSCRPAPKGPSQPRMEHGPEARHGVLSVFRRCTIRGSRRTDPAARPDPRIRASASTSLATPSLVMRSGAWAPHTTGWLILEPLILPPGTLSPREEGREPRRRPEGKRLEAASATPRRSRIHERSVIGHRHRSLG
jgi:hypothetical protein